MFEARCPYHRKNEGTGCKKSVSAPTASAEANRATCQKLMHLCNQAKKVRRQRHHLGVVLEPVPPLAVVRAQQIPLEDEPTVRVCTDRQLDLEEGYLEQELGVSVDAESSSTSRSGVSSGSSAGSVNASDVGL